MARNRKPRPRPLDQVAVGDIFALPLEGGRWGACRVVGKSDDPLQVLVRAVAWNGEAPPADLTDPRLTMPLLITHHGRSPQGFVLWVSDPVPVEAAYLGNLPERAAETTECHTYGSWTSPGHAHAMQWRWDHDREALLAEEEQARRQREADEHERRFGYQKAPPTLEELRLRVPYPNHGPDDYPSAANVRLTRRILRELIDTLLSLEVDGTEAERLDAFHRAVERFNETEDGDDPFIETVEREYLCELIGDIGDAAGLTDYDVTAWRDW